MRLFSAQATNAAPRQVKRRQSSHPQFLLWTRCDSSLMGHVFICRSSSLAFIYSNIFFFFFRSRYQVLARRQILDYYPLSTAFSFRVHIPASLLPPSLRFSFVPLSVFARA